jgi:hypothetical protein
LCTPEASANKEKRLAFALYLSKIDTEHHTIEKRKKEFEMIEMNEERNVVPQRVESLLNSRVRVRRKRVKRSNSFLEETGFLELCPANTSRRHC